MGIFEIMESLNFSNIMWQVVTPLIFSCADFITGYIQAVINKNVESQKMRVGLLHKILIFLVIILSFIIQFAFNIAYVSNFVCVYVIIMEVTSIIENLKKAGLDTGKLGNILKQKVEDTTPESINKLTDTLKEEIADVKGDE